MSQLKNPALKKLTAQPELIWGQVLVRRREQGYELRHEADRALPPQQLHLISIDKVRSFSQYTAQGFFRPLKSAPNLPAGWRLEISSDDELEFALNQLYPGTVADWFALQTQVASVTDYRDFTARQTGMYRIATLLDDKQAAHVIRACCYKKFCLKQRLWTVQELETDPPGEKSLIPCLEPCAILLEFARKGMRIEQEEPSRLSLSPSDVASLEAALKIALEHPETDVREADFSSPANPRRLKLVLEKLQASGIKLANDTEAD